MRQRLLKAGLGQELVDWVIRCTTALLQCNTFEYDGALYTQKDGAGIGQPQAASYAGISTQTRAHEAATRGKTEAQLGAPLPSKNRREKRVSFWAEIGSN